jgi:hypothetical protein
MGRASRFGDRDSSPRFAPAALRRLKMTLDTARVIQDKFLIEEWQELSPGAYASGVFMLAIDSEGRYKIGHSLGVNTPKTKIIGAFILGRDPTNVEAGKGRLKEARIVFRIDVPKLAKVYSTAG